MIKKDKINPLNFHFPLFITFFERYTVKTNSLQELIHNIFLTNIKIKMDIIQLHLIYHLYQ